MKCPNCSFENRDDVKVCRVCGEVLVQANIEPEAIVKPSKYQDTPDESIDDALSSLFGAGEADEDDLDAAAMSRLLSKRRLQKAPDVAAENHFEAHSTEVLEKEKPAYNMRIIWLFSIIIIVLFILFKTSWSSSPWKYSSNQETTNTSLSTTEAPTETSAPSTATTEIVESTEEATTLEETTIQTTTQSQTEPPTEAPTATVLEGFTSTGSFKGGTESSGQDIAFARFGLHDGFERLVFDIYEWVGGKPTETVTEIGAYQTSISDDGKTIFIQLTGAINAYAKQETLDLKGSKTLLSVSYDTPNAGEMVQVTLRFSEPVQYKVFNLKSDARLVVDFARDSE